MGIIRRQSIQATLVLAVGVLLGFVLKLFVFTAYLSVEQVGLLTVLLDVANLVAAFIPLGSQSIFVRYFPHFSEKTSLVPKGLLSLGLILSLLGFLVFTFLFIFFHKSIAEFYSQQAPLFARYIYFLLPLVLARVIFIVGQAYARALKKNVFPLVVKEILVRILTGLIIIAFAAQWFELDGLVLLFVGLYFASGAIMTYYLFNKRMINFSLPGPKLAQRKGWEIFYFGLFAVMTSAGEIIIRNIDSLMLTSLESLAATGVYSIAFFIGQIIEMPRRAVSQITAPFVAEASARNDQQLISTLYHKSSINQFLIGALLLICVWVNIDSLFALIPNGNLYQAGKYVVLFIGLGKLFDMSMGINSNIIQNSRYYRFNFYTMSLLAVLGVTTNLLLIPRYGLIGAAIASLISISLVNIIKAVFIGYKFGLQPFRSTSIWALGIAGSSYLLALSLPALPWPLADMIYRVAITVVVFAILTLASRVSPDINQLLWGLLKKFRS